MKAATRRETETILAKSPSKTRTRRGGGNPALMVRQLHLYLGVFFAPALLFFAVTGALQTFSLHESHGDYRPAPLIEKLGEVHKNQRFALKPKRPDKPKAAAKADRTPTVAPPTPLPVLVVKWFAFATAMGLIGSVLLGLWMGLTQSRNRALALALLAAGVVVPVALLLL